MKELEGLTYRQRWLTLPGCVEGCLDFLDVDVSDAWLWGASGQAFFLNIADNLCPSAMFSHRFGMHERGQNAGYEVESACSWRGRDGFEEGQQRAWDLARQGIDDGYPSLLWEWEWLLVYGCDDDAYYVKGDMCPDGKALPWRELGGTPVGWMELNLIRPAEPAADATAVREALAFAVEFWETPEKWVTEYKGARAGYDQWIAAMEEGINPPEAARTAAVYAESRQLAAAFLREAKERIGGDLAPEFDQAIGHYDAVAHSLRACAEALPYVVASGDDEDSKGQAEAEMEANAADPERLQAAIDSVATAREGEGAAVAALDGILAEL